MPTVQNNLNCLYWARVGTPDILWSVNKLARAVTKWTKACDKRLARGQEDGVPKASAKQAAADPRGSGTCVCANTLVTVVAPSGGEGRINVLPWYRLVRVAKNLQRDAKEEEPGCPQG